MTMEIILFRKKIKSFTYSCPFFFYLLPILINEGTNQKLSVFEEGEHILRWTKYSFTASTAFFDKLQVNF